MKRAREKMLCLVLIYRSYHRDYIYNITALQLLLQTVKQLQITFSVAFEEPLEHVCIRRFLIPSRDDNASDSSIDWSGQQK